MKKVIVTVVATILLVGSTFSVNAAGLRDVFSAKYYADRYPDLKAAFGYDEEMLWQHFLDYGLSEGRNMSPILDVQEYRKKYEDLDAAFGDNWDAYVEHFFDYGINENRDTGTNFDVKTYIEAYDDIEAAFGNDYSAVVEHFLTFGMEENRTMGDPEVYEAAQAPQVPPQDGGTGSGSTDSSDDRTYFSEYICDEEGNYSWVLCYSEKEYNAEGLCIKETTYTKDGDNVVYYYIYGYDDAGNCILKEKRDANDVIILKTENTYNENNILVEVLYSNSNGITVYYKYDVAGKVLVWEDYNESGGIEWANYNTYSADGKLVEQKDVLRNGCYYIREYNDLELEVKYTFYYPNGTDNYESNSYVECQYDENGVRVREDKFSLDGQFMRYRIFTYEYEESGRYSRTDKMYDADGTYIGYYVGEYSPGGFAMGGTYYNTDGTVSGDSYVW